MSGTWRSRHWRQDDRASSAPRDVATASSRDDDGRNNISSSSNGDNRNLDRQEIFSSNVTDGKSSRDVHDQKEWRRGQRLPSPPPNSSRNQPKSPTGGDKESKSVIEERKRATFSAAPPNAWGKPVKAAQPVVSNQDVSKPNACGIGSNQTTNESMPNVSGVANTGDKIMKQSSSIKADATKLSQSKSKQLNPVRSAANPWVKQESAAAKTPNETVFPSLDSGSDKNKSSAITATAKPQVKPTAPLSLPTNSLWGKSQSRATSIDTANGTNESTKVEEFPSLSTASFAPRSTQQLQPSPSTPAAPTSKEKGSKTKAPNLASFLPPQLSGNKKKTPASRSKQSTSSKTVTAVKKTTAGIKRSVTSSAPRATGAKLQSFHPSIINPVDGPALKKGRQRLTPKKKKLTTLKKRVLEERLRVWKERNATAAASTGDANDAGVQVKAEDANTQQSSSTILIENFVRPSEDDLNDEDEYEEIVSNILSLSGRVGQVTAVYVPRPAADDQVNDDELSQSIANLEEKYVGSAFVQYSSAKDANAARDIIGGIVVGGQKIGVAILNGEISEPICDQRWKLSVLRSMSKCANAANNANSQGGSRQCMSVDPTSCNTIILHNILTDDDYDDSDALAESIEDISSLARQYGEVVNVRASSVGLDKGNVYATFADDQVAEKAAKQMNGMIIGGSTVLVTTQKESPHFKEQTGAVEVLLENVLNEHDFEDEDCLNESIEDISNIARRYGVIGRVYADTTGEQRGRVHIEFLEGDKAAQDAAGKLDGMVMGGSVVTAKIASSETAAESREQQQQAPPPVYSGNKIIPERFAECKRVPKIPNSGPRSYAVKVNDDRAVPLLIEMLGELMRLQERSKDDKNARARRRLVMGLREVARGIRAHKVKMVVMANNLDEYGAIDAKLQEILEIARAEDVPVVFEFNKRKLGKAIGKSIKVSVVGIQSADGAQEQFKKLRKILGVA